MGKEYEIVYGTSTAGGTVDTFQLRYRSVAAAPVQYGGGNPTQVGYVYGV